MLLYKYRSIENFKWLLDILMNERLYGASFKNLNDPMEGAYRYDSKVPKAQRNLLLIDRSNTLICSLSERSDIGLMWTHYANEGKGCCIEIEVTSKTWKRIPVVYSDVLPNANDPINIVLGTKSSCWEYEKEVRYIRTVEDVNETSRHYLEVQVTNVIFGYNVSLSDFNLYKKLIEGINKVKKKKSNQITCEKINSKDDVKWTFK